MKKNFKTIIVALVIAAAVPSASLANSVPMYLNFHSKITDGGGNTLPDGASWFTFRLLEADGSIVFEERQELQVVSGGVSAAIGGGIDSKGAPSGGLPAEIFFPDGSKYLEVIPDDAPPLEKMEIVSSPYSIYSQTALGVVPKGINGDMIADGSIRKEHLDDELAAAVFPQGIPRGLLPDDTVFKDDLTEFKNTVQSGGGASSIGVEPRFVFSGSATVQGVLSDLDLAIKKRQEEISIARSDAAIQTSVEAAARATADQQLESKDAQLSSAIAGKVGKLGDEMSGAYLFKNNDGEIVAKIYPSKTLPHSTLFGHDPMGDPSRESGFISLYSDEQETLRLDGQIGLAKSAIVESEFVMAKKIEAENLPTAVAWANVLIRNTLDPCSVTAGRNILSNVECQRVNDYTLVTLHLDKTKLQSITAPYLVQAGGDGSFYCESMTDDSFVVRAPLFAGSFNVLVIK